MNRIPPSELHLLETVTWSAALGDPADGYVSLVDGLARAQALRERAEPWGEALVGRWQRELAEFRKRFSVQVH